MRRVVLFAFFVILEYFAVPVIIGLGVGEILLQMHQHHNQHILAGIAVCLVSGIVVTWVPMLLLLEKWGEEKEVDGELQMPWTETRLKKFTDIDVSLWGIPLLLGIIGAIAPIIFGFRKLGLIMAVLLSASALFMLLRKEVRS